jgi:hypothetical protein
MVTITGVRPAAAGPLRGGAERLASGLGDPLVTERAPAVPRPRADHCDGKRLPLPPTSRYPVRVFSVSSHVPNCN